MSIEWFLKLKEIDSLSKMRIKYLSGQNEQDARLSKLNERRHEAQINDDHLKAEHSSLQQMLFETEQKLKTASTQLQRLREIGADEAKCLVQIAEIEKYENLGLELLEKIDGNHTAKEDSKTFMKGLEKTIQEIRDEVQGENQGSIEEMRKLALRIQLLTDELPQEFQALFNKISSKNLSHGPFTRIDNGHCLFCRYKISRLVEDEIDMQKILKTCTQCDRIFLPYGS